MNRNTGTRPPRVSGTVLLADPHTLVIDGLQGLIETEYRVVGRVADGESLVTEARRLRPTLVVSEVPLRVLGGLEAARRVLAERPGTRVVMLSPSLGSGDPDALRARGGPGSRGPHLGPRAREVVRLLALGHSMKGAASVLGIAPRTVAYHKYGAMAALGLASSAELVRFAVGAGLLEPDSLAGRRPGRPSEPGVSAA